MGLDAVELVMAVEEEFGINVPDEGAENLVTPNALADFVMATLGQAAIPTEWTREAALGRIMDITAEQLGVPREAVHPSSNFVDDLAMD